MINTLQFFESNPAVYHPLLDSDKLNELIEDFLGEDYVFTVSQGAIRTHNTRWHHDDIAPEGHLHVKVIFYLEPVRATTGCLSVLPGEPLSSLPGAAGEIWRRHSASWEGHSRRLSDRNGSGRSIGVQCENLPCGIRRGRETARYLS